MHALIQEKPLHRLRLFERQRPTRAEAEEAVKIQGLRDTPARVVRAYSEWFSGYTEDPADHLTRTFEELGGYEEPILLRAIPFCSFCEHHLAPITGVAHIGYLPAKRVIGISKLARLLDCVAKRLQIQERMTAEIAGIIDQVLQPRGVGVVIEATHACMSSRGVHKHGVSMVTSRMLGAFKQDSALRSEFLANIRSGQALHLT